MRTVAACAILAVLSLGFAACAAAADVSAAPAPSAAPTPSAAVPAADAQTGKSASDLQEKMGASIRIQIAAADKLLTQSTEEAAKPDGKRDAAKALRLKINAANAYMKVAQTAKTDAARLKLDDRQAFLDQYDQPNREKAISLFLELASAARDVKDYATAVACYNKVLTMDPKNPAATDGLKAIADATKPPAPAATNARGGNGGNAGNADNGNYWSAGKNGRNY